VTTLTPRAGVDYPRSVGEFQAWFGTDEDCLDYLAWLRWPPGFVCPSCGSAGGWATGDGRYKCSACGARSSVTAGTLFDRRRTPLTVWFTACWMFATGKDGVSAQSLQRELEIGSYQTAWAMLHRLRAVLVRPGRDLLTGTVEVDETFIGGDEPGLRGGRAKGKKSLVGVAVEIPQPRGYGRCRMAILADGSSASLHRFVTDHVEPGATVITDAWQGYHGIDKLGYLCVPKTSSALISHRSGRFRPPGMILSCGSAPRLPDHQPTVRVAATVTAFRVVEVRGDPAAASPAHRSAAPGHSQHATEDELG